MLFRWRGRGGGGRGVWVGVGGLLPDGAGVVLGEVALAARRAAGSGGRGTDRVAPVAHGRKLRGQGGSCRWIITRCDDVMMWWWSGGGVVEWGRRLDMEVCCFFFFHDTATTEIYTLSLHGALQIYSETLSAEVPSRSSQST